MIVAHAGALVEKPAAATTGDRVVARDREGAIGCRPDRVGDVVTAEGAGSLDGRQRDRQLKIRVHTADGPPPVERVPDERRTRLGDARPQCSVGGEALELGREVVDVAAPRDQRRLAVVGVVAAAAVVVRDESRAAGHRLHRRHAEPLVPRGAQIDLAAAIERRERVLRRIDVKLVIARGSPRRAQAESYEVESRDAPLDARHGLEPVGRPLPGVIVVQHQDARARRGDRDRNGVKQRRIDRGDQNLRLAGEALAHDVTEPRGDHDLLERQAVRRVDRVRLAVIEALVVLHEVEFPPAPRRRIGDGGGGLPGRRDDHVAVGQAARVPPIDPHDPGAEALDPVGAGPGEGPPPCSATAPGGHHDLDLVFLGREAVRVGEDRAHSAGDAEMRTQKRDLHAAVRWPSRPGRSCGTPRDRASR